MILPVGLRDQLLDIIQISAGFQSEFTGARAIRTSLCRLLQCWQPRAKCLVHNSSEGSVHSARKGFRHVNHIIIYGQCRSHN